MAKKIKKKVVKKAAKKTTKKVAKKTPARKAIKKKSAKPTRPAKKKTNKNSAPKPIQKKTTSINPYLTFNGNCEDAFNFYKSVFGGEFPYIGRFKEMPPMDGYTMSESEAERIMHVSLPISAETILMGSDSSDAFGHASVVGNNFSISINAATQADADRLFNNLSEGGKVNMPMAKTFWGSYFGMFTDQFGIQWQVSYGDM